ncbi:hypothetical protein BKA69DRAFT_1122349 [Paraphysoderma sedebokerense]|nr:hypothetical protein BKA69DRAFT_1122349 [Paraphysoderma sedebokerense]
MPSIINSPGIAGSTTTSSLSLAPVIDLPKSISRHTSVANSIQSFAPERMPGGFNSIIEEELAKDSLGSGELCSEIYDFENLVAVAGTEIKSDPQQALVTIGNDDITRQTVPRECRLSQPIPKENAPKPYVKGMFEFFTGDWVTYAKSSEQYQGYNHLQEGQNIDSIAPQVYEVDKEDPEYPSELPSSLIKPPAKQSRPSIFAADEKASSPPQVPKYDSADKDGIDVEFLKYKGKLSTADTIARPRIFDLFIENEESERIVPDWRSHTTPFAPYETTIFKVTLQDLQIKLGLFEPLFVVLALYDIATGHRLSENFHVDLNTPHLHSFLKPFNPDIDTLTKSTTALFHISHPNPNIALVIKICKTLEGDIGHLMDKYVNGKGTISTGTVQENCKRLGKYRQSLGFAFLSLYNDDSSPICLEKTPESTVKISTIYTRKEDHLSDTDLCSYIKSVKTNTLTKKVNKTIQGEITLGIQNITYEELNAIDNIVNPQLIPWKSRSRFITQQQNTTVASKVKQDDQPAPIKDTIEFPPSPIYQSHLEYQHLLYVYPVSVNLKKASHKARNVCCKVQLCKNDSGEGAGLWAIHGRSNTSAYTSEYNTSVSYHDKSPRFDDEIKISLPLDLSQHYHLKFSFYHISCKSVKNAAIETEIGHTYLKLLDPKSSKFINDGVYNLAVSTTLPSGYLSPDHPKLTYIDGEKEIFSVRIKLQSSVISQDPKIHNFLCLSGGNDKEELIEAAQQLPDADVDQLIKFFPSIMDLLFGIICNDIHADKLSKVFQGLLRIVNLVHDEAFKAKRPSLAISYVRYHFKNRNEWSKRPYEVVVKCMNTFVKSTSSPKELLSKIWFLFDVIIKSLAESLNTQKKLSQQDYLDKNSWYKDEFVDDVKTLVTEVSEEVHRRSTTGLNLGKELNEALAYFLLDLFNFMNKTFVVDLIEQHATRFRLSDSGTLLEFKFDFLSIICGYEHFIPLNLPLTSYFNEPFARLSAMLKQFKKRHFLIIFLINEIAQILSDSQEGLRLRAITALRDLLAKHELDPRYQAEECQRRISNMYLPYAMAVCNLLPKIKERQQTSAIVVMETRTIFICFLYVLKYMDKSLLLKWVSKDNSIRIIETLELALDLFGYEGREKIIARLASAIQQKSASNDAKRYIENMYKTAVGGSLRDARAQLKNRLSGARYHSQTSTETKSMNSSAAAHVQKYYDRYVKAEGLLTSEAALVILDTWELIKTSVDADNLEKLFGLVIHGIDQYQSEVVLSRFFRIFRNFIYECTQDIFKKNTIYLSELSRVLLHQCNSKLPLARRLASGLVYLLFRENFKFTKTTFSRFRIQFTVALSKLQITDDMWLGKSLMALKDYAKHDADNLSMVFKNKIEQCADKLMDILQEKVRISRLSKNDPETLADTYYRIASGYINTPDLRLASLETLTNLHIEDGNLAEAAFAVLHSAALVSEYLNSLKNKDYKGPAGSKSFLACSPNLLEESQVNDEKMPSEEGTYMSPSFSEKGLISLIENAVRLLRKAALYETVNEVYKLIVPMYEFSRNYEQLSRVHGVLKDCYDDLIKCDAKKSRILGTYYRIGFFGKRFDDLDGKEFVYKEKTVTQLPEICQRLTKLFQEKFGADFKLIQDSTKVDRTKLDSERVYVQVSHVEPYFTDQESLQRVTYFERNTNLKRFVLQTPYTKSGKAHGTVANQYIRKTIITVEKPFPYLKKRLLVVQSDDIELTPLEVSLEAIQTRCAKLREVIDAKPTNVKNLQMVLSGSVRTQVNSGPMEIANTFLNEDSLATLDIQYSPKQVEILRTAFKTFLRLCSVGLTLNRRLIGSDQVEYQEDMEEGYHQIQNKLRPLLWGASSKSAQKYDPWSFLFILIQGANDRLIGPFCIIYNP